MAVFSNALQFRAETDDEKKASGEHQFENLGKEIYPVDSEKQRSVASDGHDLKEKMN
jgi:hypothetical protein